jgi:hypothetical protein
MLPVVLMGELMAGMALGVVWPQLTAAPPAVPQAVMTAVTVPVPAGAPVPLPAHPAPPAPTAVPLPTHAPRNPFGPPHGIDTRQQATVPPTSPGSTGDAAPAVPPGQTVPPGHTVPPGQTVPPGPAGASPFGNAEVPAH